MLRSSLGSAARAAAALALALTPWATASARPLDGTGTSTRADAPGTLIAFADVLHDADAPARRAVMERLDAAADDEPHLDAHPVLSVGVGPGFAPGLGVELEASLSQSFALSGARAARQDALRAEARWARVELDGQALERRLEAARAWLELWAAQAERALRDEDRQTACHAAARLEARVRLGEATTAEHDALAVACTEAELAHDHADGLRIERALDLAGLLDRVDAPLLRADGPLPLLPPPDAAQVAEARRTFEAWPAVARARLAAQVARAQAAEARAAAGPRLGVGVVARRAADETSAVLGTVSVPLALWSLGGREAAAHEAEAARAEREAALERPRAQALLEVALHEVEHWDGLEARTREQLVPRATGLARARLRQLELGETTVLEVLEARRSGLTARSRAIEAARERAWAHLRASLIVAALTAPR